MHNFGHLCLGCLMEPKCASKLAVDTRHLFHGYIVVRRWLVVAWSPAWVCKCVVLHEASKVKVGKPLYHLLFVLAAWMRQRFFAI